MMLRTRSNGREQKVLNWRRPFDNPWGGSGSRTWRFDHDAPRRFDLVEGAAKDAMMIGRGGSSQRDAIEAEIEGLTLGDLLDRNARKHGSSPALSWRSRGRWRTMTWREYRDAIAAVACGLRALGVTRGDCVALMGANRPELLIGMLGSMCAGGAAVSLYFTLPSNDIEELACRCAAKVAIVDDARYLDRWLEVRERLPALRYFVVVRGAEAYKHRDDVLSWQELVAKGRSGARAFDDLWTRADPQDMASLVYTSGTTGKAKGVVLTHRNCLAVGAILDRLFALPDNTTTVSYLPLAHVAEQSLSLYIALTKAFHVYLCPELAETFEHVREARPFTFIGVPRVWEKLHAAIMAKLETLGGAKRDGTLAAIELGAEITRRREAGQTIPARLRLKHLLLDCLVLRRIRSEIGLDRCRMAGSGGGPLSVSLMEFFTGLGIPISEMYGMTETAGVITGSPLEGPRLGTVGQALPGVEVRIGDGSEILVRGPNCTAGYLGQPLETSELIDDEGWLHTGDIGELDVDGFLSIVDRKKEMIITAGGKNIAPLKLECLLEQHPLVAHAVVHGDREPYVVALIVLDAEAAREWALSRDLSDTSLESLAAHIQVRDELARAIDEVNQQLSRVEQIKRFAVLPVEWHPGCDELTPTSKPRRRVIWERYQREIRDLYR